MCGSPFVFLILLSLFSAVISQPPKLRGFFINCGATARSEIDGVGWLPDAPFVSSGIPQTLALPGLRSVLSTVRTFPFRRSDGPRKFCYSVPTYKSAKYLVRTTYFYGGVNGNEFPPVFDQIVDGTTWTVVNTTADYTRNMSSYYEGIYKARGKAVNVCLGGNKYTDSDPFISSIELVILEGSVYDTMDFSKYAMSLVTRNRFGYGGPILRFPNDQFDRYWQPFIDGKQTIRSSHSVPVSDFWNLPPSNIFETALTADQVIPMELQWPLVSLPNSSYYIALYFADPLLESSRVFDVSINGINFYSKLNVTSSGTSIFATQWILSGFSKITLTPAVGSSLPPLINGAELFSILTLGGVTVVQDVIALVSVKKSIQNPPSDWNGDPCVPREYSWTGIRCSEGPRIRVITLDLSSMGLFGTLSPGIASLTALEEIRLENNHLSGPIPDLSRLRRLEKLHLQDNEFSGVIPPSLGDISNLRELFIQNNNLTGEIPRSLLIKPGLNLRTSPGNQLFSSPPN